MLSYIKGDEVVGWYNAAYRLILVLLVIPGIYFMVVYPVMSRFFKDSGRAFKLSFERSFKYMSMLAFPIGVGTTLLAEKIILLIFGHEFLPSSKALQILVWSVVCIYLSQPYGHLVCSMNKQRIETKVTVMGAILNTVLNLIIIPKYSYIGASITTLLTELFVTFCYFYIFRKTEFFGNFVISYIGKSLIASIVMGLFIIKFYNLDLFLVSGIGIVIYFIIYYLIRGFDYKDMKILKDIFWIRR